MQISALSIFTIGLALMASSGVASEMIYKSVGKDGVVTYSGAPVPDAKDTTTIDVQTLSPEQRRAATLHLKGEGRALRDWLARENEAWTNADKEVRAAQEALRRAESALESGRTPRSKEWIGNLGGGSRLRQSYFQRLAALEDRVNRDRARLDRAYDERNALK